MCSRASHPRQKFETAGFLAFVVSPPPLTRIPPRAFEPESPRLTWHRSMADTPAPHRVSMPDRASRWPRFSGKKASPPGGETSLPPRHEPVPSASAPNVSRAAHSCGLPVAGSVHPVTRPVAPGRVTLNIPQRTLLCKHRDIPALEPVASTAHLHRPLPAPADEQLRVAKSPPPPLRSVAAQDPCLKAKARIWP